MGESLRRRLKTAITAKHGQSVVKVVSYGRGRESVLNQVNYIGRRGRTELETRDAGPIKTTKDVADFVEDWAVDFDTRANSRNTVHLVVSVKAGTDRDAAHAAVRDYAATVFGPNHDYVLVRHTDTEHPHSHIIVKLRGDDGTKLDPRKAELQTWREAYARAARGQGILLDASPRRDRARGRKGERMSARKARERGEATYAEAATAREVFGNAGQRHPADLAAEARGERERETYAKLGIALKDLAAYRSGEDSREHLDELLSQVHSYTMSLSKPVSLREEMRNIMLGEDPPQSVGDLLERYRELPDRRSLDGLARSFVDPSTRTHGQTGHDDPGRAPSR